jgi:hypothetical protein
VKRRAERDDLRQVALAAEDPAVVQLRLGMDAEVMTADDAADASDVRGFHQTTSPHARHRRR